MSRSRSAAVVSALLSLAVSGAGCHEPYAGVDASVYMDPSSVVSAPSSAALCPLGMLAAGDELAVLWQERLSTSEEQTVFVRMTTDGVVTAGPVIVAQGGGVRYLELLAQGTGYMAIVDHTSDVTGYDLGADGTVEGSGVLSGITGVPQVAQMDAETYWVVYARNPGSGDRAYYRSFGPNRSGYSAELELLASTTAETDPRIAVAPDGLWVSYRNGAREVRMAKRDLVGAVSVGPSVVTTAFAVPRQQVAASAGGVLFGLGDHPFAAPAAYAYQTYDATGGGTSEVIEHASTHFESPTYDVAANATRGYMVRENDGETGVVAISLDRISLADGARSEERVSGSSGAALCAHVEATDQWVAVGYLSFEPASRLRIRFLEP